MAVQPRGEVYDIGYRHYTGPREGRSRARFALWTNGVRTVLGLGRGASAKVLPILLFVSTMAPAALFVVVASFAEDFGVSDVADVPGHFDYFGIVSILILIASAIMAPELLCTDRRSQVLQLYLVRPLTALDYVVGRWLAFFTIVLALVYSGQVVMFLGFTFAAQEPLDYIRENWLDIPRFLAAGAVVAVFVTTMPLAVAGFTARRFYATGFVIGLFVIAATVPSGLIEAATGEWTRWVSLLDLLTLPTHLVGIIFDEGDPGNPTLRQLNRLNDAIPILWYIALTVGSAALLLWRYQRESR